MRRLSRPLSMLRPHYDAVVVGSGYGGGVAASRLTRMGFAVAILERGLEFLPGEFPDTPAKALAEFQIGGVDVGQRGAKTALFDLHVNRDINVLVGCGLGGTSLINANVSVRADPRVFDDPSWPVGFADDDLTTGYDRAHAMLSPVPYPTSKQTPNKLKALEAAARALDATCTRPPINVTFTERVNDAGVRQPACTLCGDCCSGCNVGSKNTTAMNYLPDAVAGGAEVFCGVQVRAIDREAGGWRVAYVPAGLDRELFTDDECFVSARIVVLAAGALGSTEILLRSRDRGLPLSAKLGTAFTGNGDVLAFGYNNDVPIDGVGIGVAAAAYSPGQSDHGPVGPTITGLIDLRETPSLDDGLVIEEGAIPGGLGAFLPHAMALAAAAFGRETDTSDRLGEISRESESLILGPYRGAINHTQTFLIMGHDGSDGKIRLDGDRLAVDWPGIGQRPVFGHIAETIRAAVAATGGTYVPNPLWSKTFGNQLVTVHPLGGCPIGHDASTGVLDGDCRVYAGDLGNVVHPDLYVCDGSMMPRSVGINPLLTISAISERAMIRLAARENLTIDLAPRKPSPAAELRKTVGIRFTERLAGKIRSTDSGMESDASITCTVRAPDAGRFIDDPKHLAELTGTVDARALSPHPLTVSQGVFNLFVADPDRVETKRMSYEMVLTADDGGKYFLRGIKTIHDDGGYDLWHDTTTLAVTLYQGHDDSGPALYEGVLRIAVEDLIKLLRTIVVTDASELDERLQIAARFGRFFAGQIFDSFGGPFSRATAFDPSLRRIKRPLRVSDPEVHFVETADGKKMRLTRHKGGTNGPVIFSHGLGVSSAIFSIDTIDTNLLEYMHAAGYDCWLLDYRASTDLAYAREQWDADLVAMHDYQPAIDFVCERTGSNSIQMIAHCYGGMTFSMAMLRGLRKVRAATVSQISTHAAVSWWPQRLLAFAHAADLMAAVGIKFLDVRARADRPSWERFVDVMIGFGYPFRSDDRTRNLTSRRVSALYGQLYQLQQLNEGTFGAIPEMFGSANITAFRHLSAIARAGHVVRADGTDDYLSDSNLRNFAIPTLFLHGALNRCFAPSGTAATIAALSRVNDRNLYERRVIAETGHIDCIFGKNAARDVYPAIVAHFNRTALEPGRSL